MLNPAHPNPSGPAAKFELDGLVNVLDFFHRSISMSLMTVTITDYSDGSCKYVSPTFEDLSGFDSQMFLNGGMNWFVNHLHPEDRTQFRINFTEGFIFLLSLSSEQRLSSYFNLTGRLIHRKGYPVWIYQQCRPIALDSEGKPLYSLNIITNVSSVMPQEGRPCWSVVEQQSAGIEPVFLAGSCGEDIQRLFGFSASPFTSAEGKIVKMASKGLSGKQISLKLKVSINTVNTHRKNIMRKLGAGNMNEVISKAMRNNWLEEH